jgi:hypothetical protein
MFRDYDFSRNGTMLVQRPGGRWERVAANFPGFTYGSDNVGQYYKGVWIPKALTNIIPASEPATDPGVGLRTSVTFTANRWPQIQVDGQVFIKSNGSVTAIYGGGGAMTPNSVYSFAFLAETENGQPPDIGNLSTSQISMLAGGIPVSLVVHEITLYAPNVYFVSGNVTSPATMVNEDFRIRQALNYTGGVGVWLSAITVILGNQRLTLNDYVRTTNASATRAVTDIRNTNFPQLSSLQGFIDVEVNVGGEKIMWSIHSNTNNRYLLYLVSGNNVATNLLQKKTLQHYLM